MVNWNFLTLFLLCAIGLSCGHSYAHSQGNDTHPSMNELSLWDGMKICARHAICRFAYQLDDSRLNFESSHLDGTLKRDDLHARNVPDWIRDVIGDAKKIHDSYYMNMDPMDARFILAMLEERIFSPHVQGLRCPHPFEIATRWADRITCVCAPRKDCTAGYDDLDEGFDDMAEDDTQISSPADSSSTTHPDLKSGWHGIKFIPVTKGDQLTRILGGNVTGKDTTSTLIIIFFSFGTIISVFILIKLILLSWSGSTQLKIFVGSK